MKILELERERIIRELLRGIREQLAADPALAERTGAMLRGELACPDLQQGGPMTTFAQISLRVPEDLLTRADALIPKLGKRAEHAARGEMKRSDVLRLALALGIEHLEYNRSQPKRRR